MPRGQYKRKSAVPALVPEGVFTNLSWWDKLSTKEQDVVKTEGEQLAVSLLNYGRSRLAIGEHLLRIKEVLEPKQLFVKFLRSFHFSVKTAYRYMNGFENAKRELPDEILQGAMARGYNMIGEAKDKPLGIYTEAVKQLPPPVAPKNAEQVNAWLDSVEQVRKKVRSTGSVLSIADAPTGDPELLLKECTRFVANRVSKLPKNQRALQSFVKALIGYTMTMAGIDHSMSFSPIAIPEGVRAERGRPRLVTSTTTATAA